MVTIKKPATKADILDIRNWLAKQSGDYDGNCCRNCMLAQYLRQAFPHSKQVKINPTGALLDDVYIYIPHDIMYIAYGYGGFRIDTFSEAFRRAEHVLTRY